MGLKKAMVEGRKRRCQIAGLLWETDPVVWGCLLLVRKREKVGQNSRDRGLGKKTKGADANVEGPEESMNG